MHSAALPYHEKRPRSHGIVQIRKVVRGRALFLIVADVGTLEQVQEIGLLLLCSHQGGRQEGTSVFKPAILVCTFRDGRYADSPWLIAGKSLGPRCEDDIRLGGKGFLPDVPCSVRVPLATQNHKRSKQSQGSGREAHQTAPQLLREGGGNP